MKSTIYDWMKEGFTLVPNSIFNHFGQLDLSSDELVLILYLLSQINQGQSVDEIERLSNQLGWSSNKVIEQLNNLLTKEYLSIELKTNKEGKQADHYTLRPLFDQLDQRFYKMNEAKQSQPSVSKPMPQPQDKSIVGIFEREFGRVLTPLELETINGWIELDRYDQELIILALKEAVIHQALSLNYIDKILLNWEKKNVRTVSEAKGEIDRFQKRNQSNNQSNQSNLEEYSDFEIPIYDWDQSNQDN